jgi:SAM-dependent methyltransferase
MTDPDWGVRRTSFGSQADAYAHGRPSYPVDAVAWVLPPGARRVLDLAAGTGRLTERLLDVGLDVVAVEPLAEMRAHIPEAAERLDGTAEAIPLDDESVDAVMVGQAFHWFDAPVATAEIRRVLRPRGRVGLCWNMLDDSEPWVDQLAELLTAEERASSMRDDQDAPYSGVEGMTPPERKLFRHAPTYDADRLVAFVHSRSQTILMPADERDAMIERVRALAPAGEFPLPLVCEAWRGEKLS